MDIKNYLSRAPFAIEAEPTLLVNLTAVQSAATSDLAISDKLFNWWAADPADTIVDSGSGLREDLSVHDSIYYIVLQSGNSFEVSKEFYLWLQSPTSPSTSTAVTVIISPNVTDLYADQQFTATVSNTLNTDVTWTCTGGSIDPTGFYTLPATDGTYSITATSVSDPLVSDTITFNVIHVSLINLSPLNTTIDLGVQQQYSVTIVGGVSGIMWTATGGTIDQNGLYTATTSGTFVVKAISLDNLAVVAQTNVTVSSIGIFITPSSVTTYMN
jgi:hypothetical protein